MSEHDGRRYGTAFAGVATGLAIAAAFAYSTLREESRVAEGRRTALPQPEAADTFAVRDVEQIRPDDAAYAQFADADRAWRESALAALRVSMQSDGEIGATWAPSASQALDDAVFRASRAGDAATSARLLEAWVERHPDDVARRRTLAQVLARLERHGEALAQWARAVDGAPADDALRAEYAAALLWQRRHDEAAAQWQVIVSRDPSRRAPRLALAQALSWGGRHAAAEPLLAALDAEAPGDSAIRPLLRATRANLTPDAATAARWATGEPTWLPYRVTLARALDAAGRPAEARDAWDRVLADSGTLALVRESAGSAASGGDSLRTATLLARAVAMAPGDRAVRIDYARALAWSGDRGGALREYDALLAARDDGGLRQARGELRVAMGDEAGGLRDLARAVQLAPTYEAYALMGDVRRWMGDVRGARVMYAHALALRPGDARVTQGLALALAAERQMLAGGRTGAVPGWATTASYAEDNSGYLYAEAGASGHVAVGGATLVGIDVDQRRIAQRAARAETRWLTGYSAQVGVQHERGPLLLAAQGGIARHAATRDVAIGRASASLQRRGARLTITGARRPAYEQLWSMRTLIDWTPTDLVRARPILARSYGAAFGMPIGRAHVDFSGERLRLDDGNARTSAGVAMRLPMRRVQALYTGGTMAYARGAGAYWAPEGFASHAVGIEAGGSPVRGVRVAARFLPGVARAREQAAAAIAGRGIAGGPPARWVGQVNAGADLSVQRGRWSATLSGGYGAGARGGAGQAGYQSLAAELVARMAW